MEKEASRLEALKGIKMTAVAFSLTRNRPERTFNR